MISSSGRHSIRITGLSNIDFRAGFSRKPTLDFKMTSTRPIQEPPPVIQVPNNVIVPPGARAILTCLTMSTVRYNLTWHRDNRNVKFLEPLRMRIMSNLSLELKTVKISDAGEYNCMASNEGGFTRASVFLTVQEFPRVTVVQNELLIALGDTSIMECKSTGVPPPLIKWFKGNPIPERKWIKSSTVVVQTPYISLWSDGSLHLERVRLQDAGDYSCMASNVAGTDNKTTTVNVFVPPIIQHGQQIFSTIEDVPLTLPCKASGVPKPSIVWSKVIAMF
ncbi:Hemicentin-1 [Crotalus adamanteus]|uniref:Hemicentin-1 n=1 Tax=Crotalus adamanteus TaxID=8729 RepID=A0AAW1BP87_CROAD